MNSVLLRWGIGRLVLKRRARIDWDEHDLGILAQLAGLLELLQLEREALAHEGTLIVNQKGAESVSPRGTHCRETGDSDWSTQSCDWDCSMRNDQAIPGLSSGRMRSRGRSKRGLRSASYR